MQYGHLFQWRAFSGGLGYLLLSLCLLFSAPSWADSDPSIENNNAGNAAQAAPAASASDSLEPFLVALQTSNFSKKVQAVAELGAQADERVLPILQAMLNNSLYFHKESQRTFILDGGALIDVLTSQPEAALEKSALSRISTNNRLRNDLTGLVAAQQLMAPEEQLRYDAARNLLNKPLPANAALLEQALAKEESGRVKDAMEMALSLIRVKSEDPATRLQAVEAMSGSLHPEVRAALNRILAQDAAGNFAEPDKKVRDAALAAQKRIETKLQMSRIAENTYFGLALGAVLLLAAVGLAITFGVMGVINMAHGEMIMLGAYTTFVIQQLMPNHIDYSLFVAVPVAFLVTGAVGILIERGVIRFLYGRPLETLLATFGISLILQQAVRTIFSPLNQSVATPSWMSGSFEVNAALSLTYNRLYIILFALAVLGLLVLLLKKTFFGLQMRAVTQNRPMASSMGIRTGWVDALTFGLGSGIAGIAGVALSQLTNVGPNLGQAYIIDSFMVVVFGGVGNLMGTFVAAMSLGIINKIIEPFSGAVLAKILVLIFIILFIQKRPRGLFALKGRFVEG